MLHKPQSVTLVAFWGLLLYTTGIDNLMSVCPYILMLERVTMPDIHEQETQRMPVPPIPEPPKVTISGLIMLQPMPDGTALAQINLNRVVAASILIPADVVRAFIAEYLKQQKSNQAIVHAVRKLSH